jgi:hypothetical protein
MGVLGWAVASGIHTIGQLVLEGGQALCQHGRHWPCPGKRHPSCRLLRLWARLAGWHLLYWGLVGAWGCARWVGTRGPLRTQSSVEPMVGSIDNQCCNKLHWAISLESLPSATPSHIPSCSHTIHRTTKIWYVQFSIPTLELAGRIQEFTALIEPLYLH